MWPFSTPYPEFRVDELFEEYDYVVVGALLIHSSRTPNIKLTRFGVTLQAEALQDAYSRTVSVRSPTCASSSSSVGPLRTPGRRACRCSRPTLRRTGRARSAATWCLSSTSSRRARARCKRSPGVSWGARAASTRCCIREGCQQSMTSGRRREWRDGGGRMCGTAF